jgi:hypothetical protein
MCLSRGREGSRGFFFFCYETLYLPLASSSTLLAMRDRTRLLLQDHFARRVATVKYFIRNPQLLFRKRRTKNRKENCNHVVSILQVAELPFIPHYLPSA